MYTNLYYTFVAKQCTRYCIAEGSVTHGQVLALQTFLAARPDVKTIVEVGFNGGRSCAAMLAARPDIVATSFDLGHWDYVQPAAALVAEVFGAHRHTLHLGDSTETLPKYALEHPGVAFDAAFVDGGHIAPVPQQDIANCCALLRPGGFLILDDYCPTYGNQGVMAAYDAAVASGLLVHHSGPYLDGDRGWVIAQTPGAVKN